VDGYVKKMDTVLEKSFEGSSVVVDLMTDKEKNHKFSKEGKKERVSFETTQIIFLL